MTDTLLDGLNDKQRQAVTLPPHSALILAGAGSGKTRVLTTGIAWLVSTGQISPQGILAVTFTNKAAKEMLTRLSAMLPINTRGMWIGTFHGLCNRLLRTHHGDAALPQTFQILDTEDQLSAIKRLIKAHNVDAEKLPPKEVMYFINGAKDQGLRADKIEAYNADERKKVELYQLYDEQCQREGVVDFAELLLRSYELLSRNQPLREHYQQRFRHILVDEFQDTNDLQYKWLKLLAGVPGQHSSALFAVGDDDQSIYAFRGANVGNMSAFEREFQVKNLIKLEQNYRSHGHILDAANQLLSNNSKRLGKNMRTDAGQGEPVRVYEASSDLAEAQWIVEETKNLISDGAERREIAVLYRSNAQSRVIEHALFSAGIPYHVYGGLRYFQRAEVKHAIAYLQLMDNPHNDSAFLRVVNFPTRGIGLRSIEALQAAADQYGISLYAAVPHVAGKAGSALAGFVRLIEGARFETQQMALPELVRVVLEQSGLLTHYQTEKEGADRIENLEQMVSAATQFVSEEGYGQGAPAHLGPAAQAQAGAAVINQDGIEILDADAPLPAVMSPLSAFLSHASLEAGDNQATVGQDAVQMMTVHSAKGLEFNNVFITGLEEGLFPHESSSREHDGVEEERRLMYVAITRARKAAWDEAPLVASDKALAQQIANKSSGTSWRIGQSVVHAKFGEGVIVN